MRFIEDMRNGVVTLDGDGRALAAQDNQSTQLTMEGSRMRIEQHIVAAWAARLANQAVSDVIRQLVAIEADLSGDSGLENAWDSTPFPRTV